MLSPPTRLNSIAELSMGSRPRLSAAAAFAAQLEPPGRRPESILINNRCPHAVARFQGAGFPLAEARPYMLSPPSRLNLIAKFSMGSRPRLSAAAAFAAQLEPPGRRPESILINNRCPHAVARFQGAGFPLAEARPYMLSPPSRLNLIAKFSMGSRPRLSAAAAFAAQLEPLADARGVFY